MRKRGQRLETELDIPKLVAMREAGTPIATCAKYFGVSHATITKRLVAHAGHLAHPGNGSFHRKLTPEVVERRKLGASYREIAREFDVNPTAVMSYLKKHAPELVPGDEGTCEGCGQTARLVSDHSHKTGKNRGKLCQRCNVCLGRFHDDAAAIAGLVSYLERYGD